MNVWGGPRPGRAEDGLADEDGGQAEYRRGPEDEHGPEGEEVLAGDPASAIPDGEFPGHALAVRVVEQDHPGAGTPASTVMPPSLSPAWRAGSRIVPAICV